MAWSGGNFTRANPTWVSDAAAGIGIEAARHDTQDNDFTTGINECLNKTGQNAMTGNLNLGGNLPTNIGAGTAAAPALCMNNDTNTGLFSAAADQIGIATNGAERVRIDASGKVGIGTTAPAYELDVHGNTTRNQLTRYSNDVVGPYVFLQKSRSATVGTNTIVNNGDILGGMFMAGANGTTYTQGASIYAIVNGTPGASNDMPTDLVVSTTPDGSGSPTERMRITSAGLVGIGTTAPTSALQVTGPIDGIPDAEGVHIGMSGGTAYGAIELCGATGGLIDFNSPGVDVKGRIIYTNSDNTMSFNTNGAERAKLTGAGNLGVGYTIGSNVRLGARGNTADSTTYAFATENSAVASLFFVRSDGLVNTGIQVGSPYNNILGVGANMYVGSDGTLYRAVSSIKYKTDVEDYDKGLAELLTLRSVYYKDKTNPSTQYAGFIAEEVLEAGMPEFIQYAADNTPDGLNYGHMMSLAVNSIKELNAKVEALEARIAALEA